MDLVKDVVGTVLESPKRFVSVAIVIPTYNEEENLKKLFNDYYKFFLALLGEKYLIQFVIIDDSSDKGKSAKLARKHNAFVLNENYRLGYGASLRKGLWFALNTLKSDLIIEMDADHPIKYIPDILKVLKKYDIAIGWEQNEWELSRKVTKWICDKILKLGLDHPTCGYIGFRREVLEGIPFSKMKSGHDVAHLEFMYWALKKGYSSCSFPFFTAEHEPYAWGRRIHWLWDFFWMIFYGNI